MSAYIGKNYEVKSCDTNTHGICQVSITKDGRPVIYCKHIPIDECLVKRIVGKDFITN